jgi:hypothetical protein
MCVVEYADVYYYAYDFAPYKHKRTAYAAMRPHFKTMVHTIHWDLVQTEQEQTCFYKWVVIGE